MNRREMLLTLPGLLVAQTASPTIRVRGIDHVTLNVSDVKRSVDFYQGLFGMPVLSRAATQVNLGVGSGSRFLGINSAGTSAPKIDHIGLAVENFNADRIAATLASRGVSRIARGDASEFYFADPDGILFQLAEPRSYRAEPSPKKGLMTLTGWSHCTNFVPDAARANKFYQDLFGWRVQALQGPTAPLLNAGAGVEFLMFAGAGGGSRGSINHLCMTIDNFKPDEVQKALESYGIKPRGSAQGAAPPLVHYVTLRMENRGGAKEGTPELYFTDPDGLLIQLQDSQYCGGGGTLGEICG